MKKYLAALLALPVIATATPRGGTDADTRAWWATTTVLSNDGMEGRDTGSGAYQRAADIVAVRFKAAGLKPIGRTSAFRDWSIARRGTRTKPRRNPRPAE